MANEQISNHATFCVELSRQLGKLDRREIKLNEKIDLKKQDRRTYGFRQTNNPTTRRAISLAGKSEIKISNEKVFIISVHFFFIRTEFIRTST